MSWSNNAFRARLGGRVLVWLGFLLTASLAVAQASPQATIMKLATKAESFEAQGRWEAAAGNIRRS